MIIAMTRSKEGDDQDAHHEHKEYFYLEEKCG